MALAGLEFFSSSDPIASALQVLSILVPVSLCICVPSFGLFTFLPLSYGISLCPGHLPTDTGLASLSVLTSHHAILLTLSLINGLMFLWSPNNLFIHLFPGIYCQNQKVVTKFGIVKFFSDTNLRVID